MGKRRTREHIVTDLSVNFVERIVLRCGHVVNRFIFDYGYDLYLKTFDEQGEAEAGSCLIQLKASDSPKYLENGREVSLVVERRDLELWSQETMPVFLVLYDAPQEMAFWVHIQSEAVQTRLSAVGEWITLRLQREALLTEEAVGSFRQLKQDALKREKEKYG